VELPGISARAWPARDKGNLAITWSADARRQNQPLMVSAMPDLHVNGDAQVFPRYTWEPATAPDGALNLESLELGDGEVLDGYRRVDNITDATLEAYRRVHGDTVTKDDIFYGIY